MFLIKLLYKITKKTAFLALLLAMVVGIFIGGFFAGQSSKPSIEKITGILNKEENKPTNIDFSTFWDAWRLIEKEYADKKNISRQNMLYGAISGMVESLGDPYTSYLNPEEAKKFLDDVSGHFEGIGAEIGIRKGILTVIAPLKNTPAEKAGLRAGDKIIKIDDTLTIDINLDKAISLIRGAKGTETRLLISRDSFTEAKEIKIIRGIIEIPTIKWEKKENGIFYIALYNFSENASSEFRKAVNEFLTSDSQKLILDLRNNPGGYLEVSIDIASWFLNAEKIVVKEQFSDGAIKEHKSFGYNAFKDVPTILLVNEGSASASEILAGALKDNLGTKLVGKKTYGKGSVQTIENLSDSSSLKITIAKWLTPSDKSINNGGIAVDYEVELTDKDIEAGKDAQLEKAMELLK